MIVKMNKYTLVVYNGVKQSFLDRLQELGLVDVTTAGWEPNEEEHRVLSLIERHRVAAERFAVMAKDEANLGAKPFSSGDEAFDNFVEASTAIESIEEQIAKLQKEADDLTPWGDFDARKIAALADEGIVLHFYHCYTSEFQHNLGAWSEQYDVESIAEHNGTTYFAVVSRVDEGQPAIDAQSVVLTDQTAADKRRQVAEAEQELQRWNEVMKRCLASAEMIAAHGDRLKDSLQFSRVARSGDSEVEDRITVLEAFAPVDAAQKVDAFLDSSADMFYTKAAATIDDNAPVKLKNNRFAQAFQWIGDFYALPKYGTMDLTPYFAPFYMLFFGFCISDAGYGLLFLLIGIFMYVKKMKGMKLISQLVMWLGVGTILFGLLIGSFFGVPLTSSPLLADGYRSVMQFVNDRLFYIALCVGGVQLIFGMTLKVINTSIVYGFRYSFGTLGWLLILLSCICGYLLPLVGVEWYSFGSVPFYVTLGIGAVMMLLLHNPDKNILVNFGGGLWNTYNNVTGLLGDVLSYVRLFALSLSGSALALVFNDLAFSLAPDIPVVRQLVIFVILAIGHGMNIFMSAIGAFAHPMRLTFVEFYKAAGFEASDRPYTPFEKVKQTNN
ncbi:MAG: V-type ATPase 116kDa subunit family protein [Tidjanibacter sp.]|nr:V-type ATPase 116kDa subunit family protein [Tidjanibacter sp.]